MSASEQAELQEMVREAGVVDAQFTNPVTAACEVLARKSCRTVDGVLLDTFTASGIVAVWEKLSPENRAKLEAMSLERAARICMKICGGG